ncbi:MAG: PAS domain S-box protein [Hyphomicrobiaceae bacterium]
MLAILVLTSLGHLISSNEELVRQRTTITQQLFAAMISDSVISFDLAGLDSLIANALKNNEILYIRIRDAKGRILAVGGPDKLLRAEFAPSRSLDEARSIGRFEVSQPLEVAGAHVGQVEMGLSLANTETAVASATKWLLSLSLMEVILAALFSYVVGNMLTRRISTLQQAAQQVASGSFGIQVPEGGKDELSSLARDFNKMSLAFSEHENELHESRERLAATVTSALDGVIVADAQGKIVELNEQASHCFGYSRDYAIGRDLAELIIPERMRAMHSAGMKRYIESGETKIIGQRIEIFALHAEGYEFPVELTVDAAHSSGGKIFVAYVRDISERRKNEQDLQEARENAEAADETKSRFLAVMSHEMRTPLNGITGVLQILRDTPLAPDQRELIETAERSGELLLDLINDVLDISKMDAGKLRLNKSDFISSDLFQRIVEIMSVDLKARRNTLTIQVDENIPTLLHGDGKRIMQILLNLTSNANKFTNGGQIHLVMRLVKMEAEHAVLEFSVSDTGIGIPEDRLKNVFSEFTSLEDSYNRRQGGRAAPDWAFLYAKTFST